MADSRNYRLGSIWIVFREKLIKLNLNTEKLAQLYQEFAEEDRQLAEEGINEYADLLTQEERGVG
ncbi:MAG: hypothetical protein O4805_08460 [Trichodesmium sp. St16_bin2-tuft]|jgi:hypothetical protein|nr:hypothetical protein [Trichodesmium sp. St16_bin2-tuft]